ncbi:MAG TPA: response regulator [Candidatus Thermoplasmatota archaeon]|nr:response regulator [Candidatus Thermoplasmatota archaeon]
MTAVATRATQREELRVLIVDDDFLFTDMLPRLLRKSIARPRLACEAARSVDQAMTLLATREFDVILCDYDLRTVETGLDVLRRATHVPSPPFRILVSGHARREIPPVPEGVIEAFLEKPMTLREVLPLLTALLRDRLGVECEPPQPDGAPSPQ